MTVREEVRERIRRDALLAKLRKKIDSGKATYADTAAYSIRSGKLLGEIFSRRLPEIPLEEREPLCVDLLHDQYIDINVAVDTVQRFRDEAQGFHLAPQHAPFDSKRGHQIGSSLRDLSKPVEVLQRRAKAATETTVKSMHDDRMKSEAKFRHNAGLDCRITRVAVNGCCPWCSDVAGRYRYGEEPDDIYKRHDNCDCTVTFENGRKRQDVWSKREWEAPEPGAGAGERVVLTEEQARELEEKHQLEVLTGGQKPDIINQKISDRMLNSHVYTDDEKKLAEMGVIPFNEIEDALMASPIGRHVAQYIESQNMVIELDYISDSNGLSGEINDPFITVYVADMRTIEEVVETIVHETAHTQFDWQHTQEDEINCRIYEYLSTHDEISEHKIREIVDFVRDHYSDFPEGNLYGYKFDQTS